MRRVGSKFSDTLRSCSGSWMKKCLAVISANLEPYNLIKFLAVSHNNNMKKAVRFLDNFFFPAKIKNWQPLKSFIQKSFPVM